MKKLILIFFFICISFKGFSQNLVADVKVDYSLVQSSNNQVFQTLEKSLSTFINSTKWSSDRLKVHERIEANFVINIKERDGNNFKASILIQSRRPVFNSTYFSPILNLNDENFSFQYQEFEQLIFNDRKFSGKNLIDVITYYVYLILGYDADSFTKNGGTDFFNISKKIADFGQSSNKYLGWSERDGLKSRMSIINNILKNDNQVLRNIIYNYHRNGLDVMYDNELQGKNAVGNSLLQLDFYQQGSYSQFYPLELFFTAKNNEISQIFSGGSLSSVNIQKLKEILNSLAPKYNDSSWSKMKK